VGKREFRLDFLIGIAALVVSAVAAGASAYQTYVIGQQYQASVWPYLELVGSASGSATSGTTSFDLTIRNVGLGPALIRSTVFTRNGKAIVDKPNESAVYVALAPEVRLATSEAAHSGKRLSANNTFSSLNAGDVIPAGDHLDFLHVEGTLAAHTLAASRQFDLAICYCSLLGRCWRVQLKAPSTAPQDVHSCAT
jgi:hypothetical protein